MWNANWAAREFCLSTPRGPISTTIFGHGLKVLRACRQDQPHASFSEPRRQGAKIAKICFLGGFAPLRLGAPNGAGPPRDESAHRRVGLAAGLGCTKRKLRHPGCALRVRRVSAVGGRRSGADCCRPGAGLRFLEFWNTAARLASTFQKTASLSPFDCGQAWKHRHSFGWHVTMKPEFTT
jgi:hypothetical protein